MLNPFLALSNSSSPALDIFSQPKNDNKGQERKHTFCFPSNQFDDFNSQATYNPFQTAAVSTPQQNSFLKNSQQNSQGIIFSFGQKDTSKNESLFSATTIQFIPKKKDQKEQTSTTEFNKQFLLNNVSQRLNKGGQFSFGKQTFQQQTKGNLFYAKKEENAQYFENIERIAKPNLKIQIQSQIKEITQQNEQDSNIGKQFDENEILQIFKSINIIKKDSKQQIKLDLGFDDKNGDKYLQKKKNQPKIEKQLQQKREQFKISLTNPQINPENYRQTLKEKREYKRLELQYKIQDCVKQTQRIQNQKQKVHRQLYELNKYLQENTQIEVKRKKTTKVEDIRSPKFREYENFNLLGNNKQIIQFDKKLNRLEIQVKTLTNELLQKKRTRDNLKRDIQNLQLQKQLIRRQVQHNSAQQGEITVLIQKYNKYYAMYRKIKDQSKSRQGIRQLSKATSDIFCLSSDVL